MAYAREGFAPEGDGSSKITGKSKNFDAVIVNDDLERAYGVFKAAVTQEDDGSGRFTFEGDAIPTEGQEGQVLELAKAEAEAEDRKQAEKDR